MKKTLSLLLLCFTFINVFAQTDTLTPEQKARKSISAIKDNTIRAITPGDFRKAFTDLANLSLTRMPFISMSELRAGKADTARVVQINAGKQSGVFSYDPADLTSPDDSAMVIRVGNRRYKRTDGIYNIYAFGAKGDGVVDDTKAIQKAIKSLPDGATLIIPSGGTFKISEITFSGRNQIITGGGELFGSVRIQRSVDSVFDATAFDSDHMHITFNNVSFSTNNTLNTKAVILRNARDINFVDCKFSNSYYAIFSETRSLTKFQHVAKVTIQNSKFYFCSYGVYNQTSGNNTLNNFWEYGDFVLQGNKFFEQLITAFAADRQDGLLFQGNEVYFKQSSTTKKESVYLRACTYIQIKNNQLFESGLDAVKIISPTRTDIIGNLIAGAGVNGADVGLLTGTGSGIVIEGADPGGGNLNISKIIDNTIENTRNDAIILRQVSGAGVYPSSIIVSGNIAHRIGARTATAPGDEAWRTTYRLLNDTGCFGIICSNNISTYNRSLVGSNYPTGNEKTVFENNYDYVGADRKEPIIYRTISNNSNTLNIYEGSTTSLIFTNTVATVVDAMTSTYKRDGQRIYVKSTNSLTTIQNGAVFVTVDGKDLTLSVNKIYVFELWNVGASLVMIEQGRQFNELYSLTTVADYASIPTGFKTLLVNSSATSNPLAGNPLTGFQVSASNNPAYYNRFLFGADGTLYKESKANTTQYPIQVVTSWKSLPLTTAASISPNNDCVIYECSSATAFQVDIIQYNNTILGVQKIFKNNNVGAVTIKINTPLTINGGITGAPFNYILNQGDLLWISYNGNNDWSVISTPRLKSLNNNATTAPTSAGLNTQYGTYKAGTVVNYPNISGGGIRYEKADDTNISAWYSDAITVAP